MSYCSQSNLAEVELYNGLNKVKKKKRPFKVKSKPPVIKFTVKESPELLPEERTTIDAICASGEVFFKPRKTKTAEFKAKEPWHFIFMDIYSYQGWLYANRLTNPMFVGYDADILNMTSSGEGAI